MHPEEHEFADFNRSIAEEIGRLASSLFKSKRSMTWNAPLAVLLLLLTKSCGSGNGLVSVFNHDAEPRLAVGVASFMDASPVACSVILFGGLSVGDDVGLCDGRSVINLQLLKLRHVNRHALPTGVFSQLL